MTRTAVESFTLIQAKQLASKVASDMRRCQQHYLRPTDVQINDYGTELALLLRDGYVVNYEFGWVRDNDNERILTWLYTVDSSGNLVSNDRPGRIISGINISGCSMRNMMTFSSKWIALTAEEKQRIESTLPFRRSVLPSFRSSLGRMESDLCYSAGGTAMSRHTFKLYGT